MNLNILLISKIKRLRTFTPLLSWSATKIANPLQGIHGSNSLISRLVQDGEIEEVLELLEINDRLCQNIVDIVTRVRTLEQMSSDSIEVACVPVPVFDAIKNAIASFEKKIAEKELVVTVDGESQNPELLVLGDMTILSHQILGNLLSNCIKFSHRFGRINIRVYQKKNWVNIEIQDSGIGMNHQKVKNILF